METVTLIAIVVSGLWLIGVAILMALHPQRFLELLSLTASSWRINITEQRLRLVTGLALIGRAELSKLPILFYVSGIITAASSVILLLIPLRWHAGWTRLVQCQIKGAVVIVRPKVRLSASTHSERIAAGCESLGRLP